MTIRFTGGEPFMSQAQIRAIIRELSRIQKQESNNLKLSIIQTNGLDVKNRELDDFEGLTLPILFEVSLKGTNISEYRFLTFDHPISQRKAKSLLERQSEGYLHLVERFENKDNVQILARLGIFHSSLTKPMFKFVYPNENNVMFNPETWAPQILEIYQDQKRMWAGTFEGKMVVEKIKTGADGSPTMGKRYRRIIERLKSKNIVIEDADKNQLPKIFRDRYYYKRGNVIYERAQKVIETQIP